jgi:hypothetical protein
MHPSVPSFHRLAWLPLTLAWALAGCGSDAVVSETGADADQTLDQNVTDGQVGTDTTAEDLVAPIDLVDVATDVAPDVAPPQDTTVDAAAPDADDVADADAADVAPVDTQATDATEEVDATPDTGPEVVACQQDLDCAAAGPAAACHTWLCDQGTCVAAALPVGTACDDADACTSGEACDGQACTGGKPLICNDNNVCTSDKCLGGACAFTPAAAFCNDGDACTYSDACSDGKCSGQPKKCDDGDPCTLDGCAIGECTHTPTDGPCVAANLCSLAGTCQAGQCVALKPVDCDDGDVCTDDFCNPKLGCQHGANTSPCPFGSACVLGKCSGGLCKSTGGKGCDDGNPCTQDVCDAGKGCLYTPVAEQTQCAAGNACVAASKCVAGKCEAGAAKSCDDGDACTDDSCHPVQGCQWTFNQAPCEDGNLCTKKDACANGKCTGGAPLDPKVDCNDANACTADACSALTGCTHAPTDALCSDGNPCTEGDACQAGSCVPAKILCDDGKECTVDSCNPQTGECSWTSKVGSCSDGNACTVDDVCKASQCTPGPLKSCDDGEDCTADSCDMTKGACVWVVKPGAEAAACDGSVTGGRCVKATKNYLTWEQSEQACVTWGGHLVHVQSADDTNNLRNLANQVCGNGAEAWIGLTDKDMEYQFKWTDGQPVTYTNWSGGQPDNWAGGACAQTGEDAVHMLWNGTWNDICIKDTRGCYLCDRPLPSVTCGDPAKCQSKGVCTQGKCVGAVSICDDGNPCTQDACQGGGGCGSTPIADGAPCGFSGVCGGGKCSAGSDVGVPATSCVQVQKANPGAKEGLYWLDLDGAGAAPPFQALCRFDLAGGGWTLAAVVSNDNQNTWTWNQRQRWQDTTTFGSSAALTKDFKSPALAGLPFKDLLFVHAPSQVWAQYANVGDGLQTLAQKIAGYGNDPVCWQPDTAFALADGTLTKSGKLCDTRLYINAHDHDGKPYQCGDDEFTWGPGWSSGDGGNGCPLDDPGAISSLGACYNQANTEVNTTGFGQALGLNSGQNGTGANHMRVFVR